MKPLLHPKTAAALAALQRQPVGSVIFVGPRGLGKATAARELARELNCLGDTAGLCINCRQIAAGNFPDLLVVERGEKASLSIEQIRTLTSNLSLRSYQAGRTRVAIIDEAHLLTLEAQNALLKLLEEPPAGTLIVLATERLEVLLATVRSRVQIINFVRPSEKVVAALLVASHGLTGPLATTTATASGGVPGVAVTIAAHPQTVEALETLSREASAASDRSLFERLLLASRLISSGADLEQFGAVLQRDIIGRLASGELAATVGTAWLSALERFRVHLMAKVSPRVALECLMLELG